MDVSQPPGAATEKVDPSAYQAVRLIDQKVKDPNSRFPAGEGVQWVESPGCSLRTVRAHRRLCMVTLQLSSDPDTRSPVTSWYETLLSRRNRSPWGLGEEYASIRPTYADGSKVGAGWAVRVASRACSR
jgi:hypothetical protein